MKNRIIECLLNSENVAIYAHINIDCDGMGSSLALKEVLESLGKKVDVFINSNFPDNFTFYGNLDFVNKKSCKNYDTAICLDMPNESRLGKYKYTYRKGVKQTICIDHHYLANEKFCKINYVKQASSTAEILFFILKDMKINFTNSICKYLISGIITDTGKFSHSISNSTFYVVSKLLKLGKFSMEEITTPLFMSMKYEIFSMMQLAYQKIEFYADKKLAIIMFNHNEFKERNITLDDLDAFPDIPLQLESVKFAILASEDDKGYFRVSFRSKGNVSAAEVAKTFGGGGHLNASGCKIFGEFDEVKELLINNTIQTLGWERWLKDKLVLLMWLSQRV